MAINGLDDDDLPDFDDVNNMLQTDDDILGLQSDGDNTTKPSKPSVSAKAVISSGHDPGALQRIMSIYGNEDLAIKSLDYAKEQGAPNNVQVAMAWILDNPEEQTKAATTQKKKIEPMEIEEGNANEITTKTTPAATRRSNGNTDADSGGAGDDGGGGGAMDDCKEKCASCCELVSLCCGTCWEVSSDKYSNLDRQEKVMFWGANGCLCCIGLLLLVILLPVSIRKVDFDEYAIRYNDLTKEADDTEYGEGRYVFTPQTSLFIYDSLIQKLSLDLDCLTKDGVVMEIEVDIQYAIPKYSVFEIWDEFGKEEQIDTYFKLVASDAVRDAIGFFPASAFYKERYRIQQKIEQDILDAMDTANTHLLVTSAVLAGYGYPDEMTDVIKEKRAAENDIEIAENERDGDITDAETTYLVATFEAESLLIQARGEVTSLMNEAQAKARAITEKFEFLRSVFVEQQNLTRFNATQFVDYWLTSFVLLNSTNAPITNLLSDDQIDYRTISPTPPPVVMPALNTTMEPTFMTTSGIVNTTTFMTTSVPTSTP